MIAPRPRRFSRPFRRIVGRVFHCHLCPDVFGAGGGVFKLYWLILFAFCNRCWEQRRAQCEALMKGACAPFPAARPSSLSASASRESCVAARSSFPSSDAAGAGAPGAPATAVCTVETEEDGRHIAEVPEVPGALAYGDTAEEAATRALAIAKEVRADGGAR